MAPFSQIFIPFAETWSRAWTPLLWETIARI